MSSSSESSFTRNVRRFAHDVREIFLDFLRWDEEDETAAQAANISALEDPSSSSVMLPAGGWKLIQRKRNPTSIDFPAAQYAEDTLAEILTFDLKVDNLNPQKALLDRIMRVTFDSPTPFGMDATWGGHTAIMPLQVTLIGGDGKLPLWAHPDGCDFIRGSRLVNQTLMAPAQALSAMEVACLQTLWREVVPLAVGTPIWQVGLYDVPVLSLPDAILALGPSAIHIFHQVQGTYPAGTVEAELQLHLFKDEWAGWDEDQKRTFHGRWCYTVATSSLLLTEQLRTPIRIEFSGLGG